MRLTEGPGVAVAGVPKEDEDQVKKSKAGKGRRGGRKTGKGEGEREG